MADVLGLASGEALGRSLFRLGKELHRSGSGAVFEAIVLRTGLPVAIKRKDSSELGGRKLIEHEALLLETLSHPNVAVCFGSFVEAGSLYMVLEIADRGDLGQLIQIRHRARQHLSEQEIWGLFTQVCAGIAYMHSKKIIHRDLKPKNVLLYAAPPPRSGRGHGLRLVAKIADLGVSRQLGTTAEMANTFYGTPLYISPELCRNEAYNAKTDVWSLGVMLYELAALRPPFFGCSILELAGAITRGTYDALPAAYSTTLQASVRMMLSLSPAQRPSVDQYCRWLEHKLKPDPARAPDPEYELNSKPASERKQVQHALVVDEGHGVHQHGAALKGSTLVARKPHQSSAGRHARDHGGTGLTARTTDGGAHRVAQVHHAWSARHRRPRDDPHTRVDAGREVDEQDSSSSRHKSEFGQQKSDDIIEQYTGPSRGDQVANEQSVHKARCGWAEAQQRQQAQVPEPEPEPEPDPEAEPVRLTSAASSQSVISARDRRLEERQMSNGSRHEHQILHVRAAAMPRQYPSQFHAHGAAPAASPAGAVISDQLSRLRKSMGLQYQPADELPHWNKPASDLLNDPGTASSTERIDNDRFTSSGDWPLDHTGVHSQYPYTSSGGSSSGTDLVHRGYAASLGYQRWPAHHQVGVGTTSTLATARTSRRVDERSEPEIEVAGLASHRTECPYNRLSDRADDDAIAPQPRRNERPSTASTLRSPYAWYSE